MAKNDLAMFLNDNSPMAMRDAYNNIRTNLNLSLDDKGSKFIALTGSRTNEGLDYTSFNLAVSFSDINKKVLLIDGNMRHSSLSQKLNCSDKPGLSDYLSGSCDFESLKVNNGSFDFIPAGKCPADPASLLESPKMAELSEKCRAKYDCILILMPSVYAVSDAAVISKHIDGYVLVVRHDFTRFAELRHSIRNLRLTGNRILGFIYNNAPLSRKKRI